MSSRRSPGRPAVWIGAVLSAWLLLFGTSTAAGEPRIVVLGDSLTAGFGLPREDAFPARLEAALRAEGHGWKVIDAGVSGDTSAGGLARLDWALADAPEIVIVELGANDGLRGLPTDQMEANLDTILARIGESGASTLLAGMRAPANFGADYAAAFHAVYERLAAKHRVALYPFFLEGVAMEPTLNQGDGIHPNAAGVAEIVRRMVPHVAALIARHKGG